MLGFENFLTKGVSVQILMTKLTLSALLMLFIDLSMVEFELFAIIQGDFFRNCLERYRFCSLVI